MTDLKPGDEAPLFELPAEGGKAIRLSDLRGQAVVVYFYPQDDTETCTIEAIDFSRLAREFDRIGAAVVGISPDGVKSHARFRKKHRLKVRLGADESRATIEDYGVWVEKTLFGRTYMGVERATFLIDSEGRIARIWRKVRTKGHAEAVLAAASALSA